MVLAVIRTISSLDVILYLFVFLLITIILCISYDISFGTEVSVFSSLLTSFFELFSASFDQEYETIFDLSKRFLYTIYFIVFVILSLTLVNLFIGIISDVYILYY